MLFGQSYDGTVFMSGQDYAVNGRVKKISMCLFYLLLR